MTLAERELPGYPGIRVELHYDLNDMRVIVTDPVGMIEWHPRNKREAKDMYFHPFAYGYIAPELTSVEQ